MIISLLVAQEPEPKKTKKQKKSPEPVAIIDTTTLSKSERAVLDSIALQQRKVLKELDERIEKQKEQIK